LLATQKYKFQAFDIYNFKRFVKIAAGSWSKWGGGWLIEKGAA